MSEHKNEHEQTRYERFLSAYAAGALPWDSGIVPPEVRALVEGGSRLPPGRALDVGCGTGVSAVYLAANGWQVTGVDWVEAALERARARAAAAGLAADNPVFIRADAANPGFLPQHPPVSLWLDVGCLHSFAAAEQVIYAGHAGRLITPGGALLLYAWGRHERDGQERGLDAPDVAALFAPAFTIVSAAQGWEATDQSRPAAWYILRRSPR